MGDSFLYFGYASNQLKQWLQSHSPTAQFVSTAKLQEYRLDFDSTSSTRWQGAGATISAAPGEHVWGVVWRLATQDRPKLDGNEGVGNNIYRPLLVTVTTSSGEQLQCLAYEMVQRTSSGGLPSPHYIDVIVRGATQNSLPEKYIDLLKNVQTNGYSGNVDAYNDIMKIIGN